jgi:hypothetical protein
MRFAGVDSKGVGSKHKSWEKWNTEASASRSSLPGACGTPIAVGSGDAFLPEDNQF